MELNGNMEYRLEEHEIFKIKLSLSSLTNSVIVCPLIAKLYLWKPADSETWTYCKTGVPVLVLIHGDEKDSMKVTALQLCLVDRPTGFTTWREFLSEDSDYKMSQKNFHTLKLLSSLDGSMAGVKFPSEEMAAIFMKDVQCNMPDDFIADVSHSSSPRHSSKSDQKNHSRNGKDKDKDKRKSVKRISKDEISSPCMFTHVTSINNRQIVSNGKSSETKEDSTDQQQTNKPQSSVIGGIKRGLSFTTRKR